VYGFSDIAPGFNDVLVKVAVLLGCSIEVLIEVLRSNSRSAWVEESKCLHRRVQVLRSKSRGA
jgi:hypothetical protein